MPASISPACSGCCRSPRRCSGCARSSAKTARGPMRAAAWRRRSSASAPWSDSDAMEFKDYYQTLGVTKTSTEKEIKQAFRKLARKFHPDVNPGDKTSESRFKEINEAYEVLGDADKRRKYDELGANWRMYEQAQQQGQGFPGGSPFGFGGGAPDAWTINMGGGGGGGYRTMSPEEMQEL